MIKTSAQIDSVRRLKDKSLKLSFITGEKSSHELAEIDNVLDSFGYLVFKPENPLTNDEMELIDKLDPDLHEAKSQSQRIRNHIMVLWKKQIENGTTTLTKEDFYKVWTEKIMTTLRTHIENAEL
jgi:hypothetical protein